jgi:hypothetical protein
MMEGARFKKKKKEARVYDTKEGTRCFMLCVSWHVFFFFAESSRRRNLMWLYVPIG